MTNRAEKKVVFKEDFKHILKELWDAEEEEPFKKYSQ